MGRPIVRGQGRDSENESQENAPVQPLQSSVRSSRQAGELPHGDDRCRTEGRADDVRGPDPGQQRDRGGEAALGEELGNDACGAEEAAGDAVNLVTAASPRAGRREWIGLAVIALPCLLYAMDLTVLNLAVPKLSEDLHPSSSQLLWIIDIYGFLVAGSLITMGTLGDRIGRRRLLLIGAVTFGIGSVRAAFSRSAERP